MKYLVYILAMLPIIPLGMNLGNSFDPYDAIISESGIWMMRWFIVLLAIGPMLRSFRMNATFGKQPLGLAVFSWAVIHALGYFVFHASSIGTAASELFIRPFLTLGVIAFAFLVPLAVTSHSRMIRALRKKWNVLHKLALWAAAIGAAHGLVAQKTTINEFGLYSALILVLLLWRGVTAIRKAR